MRPDIKGLTKLADKLREVPPRQFDFSTWWEKTPCGTVGCILGWAATFFPSRFKKEASNTFRSDSIKDYSIIHRQSGLDGHEGFAEGFHINEMDAYELVSSPHKSIKTPKQAAKAVMVLVGKLNRIVGK
jgi:hypothetical protein